MHRMLRRVLPEGRPSGRECPLCFLAATYTAAKFAASARETACRETAVKQEAWQTASACICRRDLIGYRTPNGEVEVLLTLWDLGAIENLAGS